MIKDKIWKIKMTQNKIISIIYERDKNKSIIISNLRTEINGLKDRNIDYRKQYKTFKKCKIKFQMNLIKKRIEINKKIIKHYERTIKFLVKDFFGELYD